MPTQRTFSPPHEERTPWQRHDSTAKPCYAANRASSLEYSQSTGQLKHDGTLIGTGYSGAGMNASTGRNNPAMQHLVDVGPIPQGQWSIGPAYQHPTHGPKVMNLTPVGHNALGRTAFQIHGNNATNNASHGCIIMGPSIRSKVAASGDAVLSVVP